MSQNLIKTITKCLVDTLIAIEYSSDENVISTDFAVSILEQVSADLLALSADDKVTLVNEISALSAQYPKEISKFVKSIPENFGIIEPYHDLIPEDVH